VVHFIQTGEGFRTGPVGTKTAADAARLSMFIRRQSRGFWLTNALCRDFQAKGVTPKIPSAGRLAETDPRDSPS
jgi:hypothetical protein